MLTKEQIGQIQEATAALSNAEDSLIPLCKSEVLDYQKFLELKMQVWSVRVEISKIYCDHVLLPL